VGKLDSHSVPRCVYCGIKGETFRGEEKKVKEYKEGYNNFHPSELSK
jgi:hypothetical protein